MKLIEGKAIRLDKENIDLSFGEFGKILVIENPTKTQFDALCTIAKDIRGFVTLDKMYIWDANAATHDAIKTELLKQQGIEIKDPYCGFIFSNNKLGVDGYRYLKNHDYTVDPNEEYAKHIMLKNNYTLRIFSKDLIINAKNHHTI